MSDLDALFEDAVPDAVAPGPAEYYTDLPFYAELLDCRACPCREEAKRVVPGGGPLDATIAVIGRNPGKEEDRQGACFIGKSGGELDEWLALLGVSRQRVLVTNLVKCHTTDDRPPGTREVQVCAQKWLQAELLHFPAVKILLTLGDEATRFVLGVHAPSLSKVPFAPMRVLFDPAPGRELIVIPLPHPAFILRKPAARPQVVELLEKAKGHLQKHAAAALAAAG